MKPVVRHGTYFRVYKPEWTNPLDPSFSKERGGRWNAPGAFGVLYLCKTIDVAAANARHQHVGRAIGLFDLHPDRRPSLLEVDVAPGTTVVDVVSNDGVAAAGLPARFPYRVTHAACRPIGRRAYAQKCFRGIATRSAAEAQSDHWIGEELAWFDSAPALQESAPRRAFTDWYPATLQP